MENLTSTLSSDEGNNNTSVNSYEGKPPCVTSDAYLSKLPNPLQLRLTEVVDEKDTEALTHQIAGHGRTGVLKHKLGYVLKPVQDPPLGEREINFYERVFNATSSDGTSNALRQFLPSYHGVTKITSVKDGTPINCEYLILDDAVQGFKSPCIVDVKIGAQTWDPLASQAKIDHEKKKYAGTKEPLGLSITGMQYYDIHEKRVVKLEKDFGKHLNTDTIGKVFQDFFNVRTGTHKEVLPNMIKRLKKIQDLFSVQRDFVLYSSSILLAYDADQFAADYCDSTVNEEVNGKVTELAGTCVKMIDFAHVFPSENVLDTNYLFGIGNLIKLLEAVHDLN